MLLSMGLFRGRDCDDRTSSTVGVFERDVAIEPLFCLIDILDAAADGLFGFFDDVADSLGFLAESCDGRSRLFPTEDLVDNMSWQLLLLDRGFVCFNGFSRDFLCLEK